MVRILGRKPSQLRQDLIRIMIALAAVCAIIATSLIGHPQIAAFVGLAGGLTTTFNLVAAALQRPDLAKSIDSLDDVLEDDAEPAPPVVVAPQEFHSVVTTVGCARHARGDS